MYYMEGKSVSVSAHKIFSWEPQTYLLSQMDKRYERITLNHASTSMNISLIDEKNSNLL